MESFLIFDSFLNILKFIEEKLSKAKARIGGGEGKAKSKANGKEWGDEREDKNKY